MPAMPLRVQLVGRLSEDLRAAIADATFAPADVAVLDASLHQVLNGWSLSVSRFFRRSGRGRGRADEGHWSAGPLVDRVLGDLEDVFLALWNQPGALSASGIDRLDS